MTRLALILTLRKAQQNRIFGIIAGIFFAFSVALLWPVTGYAGNCGHPHKWFAWHPVRLQGGAPIPSVQEGGRVVWLKTIERFCFFGRWVYREIGDTRELTR